MLSICIPIYNYDVSRLVRDLHRQASQVACPFEILLMDDASEEKYRETNQAIDLENVHYLQLQENIGRAKIRNRLAEEAQYPYLLFMDCDSGVASESYIENYRPFCKPGTVCCGGRIYENTMPDDDTFLRWKYGMERESAPAFVRRKNPNYSFYTNNFLIDKLIFKKVKFNENLAGYGHEDTFFGLELLENGIIIQHVDNPLIHLGLESASDFLEKTENGIINLLKVEALLKEKYPEQIGHSKLTRTKMALEKIHLQKPAEYFFRLFLKQMKNRLLGKKPSLRVFDLYKLGLSMTQSHG
jgi:GT2 family glycosyltransferase